MDQVIFISLHSLFLNEVKSFHLVKSLTPFSFRRNLGWYYTLRYSRLSEHGSHNTQIHEVCPQLLSSVLPLMQKNILDKWVSPNKWIPSIPEVDKLLELVLFFICLHSVLIWEKVLCGIKTSKQKKNKITLLYSDEWNLVWIKLATEEDRVQPGTLTLDPSALS